MHLLGIIFSCALDGLVSFFHGRKRLDAENDSGAL